jgi:hypothetical protein
MLIMNFFRESFFVSTGTLWFFTFWRYLKPIPSGLIAVRPLLRDDEEKGGGGHER